MRKTTVVDVGWSEPSELMGYKYYYLVRDVEFVYDDDDTWDQQDKVAVLIEAPDGTFRVKTLNGLAFRNDHCTTKQDAMDAVAVAVRIAGAQSE